MTNEQLNMSLEYFDLNWVFILGVIFVFARPSGRYCMYKYSGMIYDAAVTNSVG